MFIKKLRVTAPAIIAAASIAVALTACADPHGNVIDHQYTKGGYTYGYHNGHTGIYYTPDSWTLVVQDAKGDATPVDVSATAYYHCPIGAAYPACAG